MPIDTEQWRAHTGLFCASRVLLQPPRCKQPHPKVQADTLSLNIKFSLGVLLVTLRTGIFYASRALQLLCLIACHASWLLSSTVRLSCRRLRCVSVLLALCLVVVQMLLIMSGDVEENPGPPKIQTTSLGVGDLSCVREELLDVSSKWFDIGLKLKLSVGALECVRDQYPGPSTALREMLLCWLKKVDPPPTWEGLACALESRTVGEPRLAEQLRTKYCKTEGAAGGISLDPYTERNLKMIQRKFLNLQKNARQVLQVKLSEEEIKEDLHLFLITIVPHKFAECLPNCSDLMKIFKAMTCNDLWNHINYFPLESLIEEFGKDTDLITQVEQFKTDRSSFLIATKIKDYIPLAKSRLAESDELMEVASIKQDPKYLWKLGIKLDESFADESLEYLEQLWRSLAKTLLLPPVPLVLHTILRQSILVVWLIPAKLGPKAVEIAHQSAEFFRSYPIQSVQIGDELVYEIGEKKFTQPSSSAHEIQVPQSPSVDISEGGSVGQTVAATEEEQSSHPSGPTCSWLPPAEGLHHIVFRIFSYLDSHSLCRAEQVCSDWYQVINNWPLWKKLIERKVATDTVWKGLSERRGWGKYLFRHIPVSENITHQFYRQLYHDIIRDIQDMESNWKTGHYTLTRIECHSDKKRKGVCCLQYDKKKIISGLRDNTIKIWMKDDLSLARVLQGHTGSVLCLQYDERVIITGSSDFTIRVWDVDTGQMLNTLVHHTEKVLHLRFNDNTMVTSSTDRTIAVWDIKAPNDIVLRRVLVGHSASVNVVDLDDRYIVSASGDRTIKVWRTSTHELVRTLHGHRRGIACLQYLGNHIVSGSSDNTIRIWDIERGPCLRVLEGHDDLVRCIKFDDKRIISGAYDGAIKVWDFQAALDPRSPAESLCSVTLMEHSDRVPRLQFDDFQIVSSSHDDTILIWDFLDPVSPGPMETEQTQNRKTSTSS